MNTIPFQNPNPTFFDGLGISTDARMVFLDPDTSLAKNVYNSEGISIGNKVSISDVGQFNPQVYYGEGDYDLMLQVYVSGDRSLDDSWANAWPIAFRATGAKSGTTSGNSFGMVQTRAQMKALSTDHGYDALIVLGYYSPNDGGGGVFAWYPDATGADDFGYICELDAHPGTGRFLWSRQPGQTSVSTNSYGVCNGISGACDTRVLNAQNVASSNGLSVNLSPWEHKFSSGFDFTKSVYIPSGCYFTATDSGSTREIGFSAPVTIERRDITNPISRKPYTTLVFDSGTLPDGARPEWWDDSYSSGNISALQVSSAIQNGGGVVRFSYGVGYDVSTTPITSRLIFEQDATALVDGESVIIDAQIDVVGQPSWKMLNVTNNGTITITSKHENPVEAWWFGWGTVSEDSQSVCLSIGYNACFGYRHTYRIGENGLGSASYIDSSMLFTDQKVFVDFSYPVTLTDGGSLTLTNFTNQRVKLFNFDGGANGGDVILGSAEVYPEWFGAVGDGTTNSSTAIENAALSASSSHADGAIKWIDFGGKYFINYLQFNGLEYVGFKNGKSYSLSLSSSSNIKFCDFNIVSNAYALSPLTPANTLSNCSSVEFNGCTVSNGNNAMPIALNSCTEVKFINTRISKSSYSGAPFYFDVNCSYSMVNCSVDWFLGGYLYFSKNAHIYNCSFISGGSSVIYVGHDAVIGTTGQNVTVDGCDFTGCKAIVSSMNETAFTKNKLRGPYLSTKITLQPRSNAEPLNFDVSENMFIWSDTPASGFTAVEYSTALGSYQNTSGYLFGSMRVGNNVANCAGYMQSYNAGNGTRNVDYVRMAKTFGIGRMIVNYAAQSTWAISDDYIGDSCRPIYSIVDLIHGSPSIQMQTSIIAGAISIIETASHSTTWQYTVDFEITTSSRK